MFLRPSWFIHLALLGCFSTIFLLTADTHEYLAHRVGWPPSLIHFVLHTFALALAESIVWNTLKGIITTYNHWSKHSSNACSSFCFLQPSFYSYVSEHWPSHILISFLTLSIVFLHDGDSQTLCGGKTSIFVPLFSFCFYKFPILCRLMIL